MCFHFYSSDYESCYRGFVQYVAMKGVHTKYSEHVFKLIKDCEDEEISSDNSTKVFEDIYRLKTLTNIKYKVHCHTGLYTFKIHLLYHVGKILILFGGLNISGASSFKQYKFKIKNSYWNKFQWPQSWMDETAKILENDPPHGNSRANPRRSGTCRGIMQRANQIIRSRPFCLRDVVRTTHRELNNALRGDSLVGREGHFTMWKVEIFYNNWTKTFKIGWWHQRRSMHWNMKMYLWWSSWGVNMDLECLRQSRTSSEGGFVQEGAKYYKNAQQIFATVGFGSGRLLKSNFF